MRVKNKGVSLIILVITIVVMSILATTAIVSISEDNIINYGNNSLDKNKLDNIREAAQMAYDRLLIKNMGDTTGITEDIIKQKVIEAGISEQDLEGLYFHIGETIRVGYKQSMGNSTNVSNNIPGILSLKIYGNSVQNGNPTPDSPVEIQSVGDKTNNLVNNVRNTQTISGVTFTINKDKSITLNGTNTSYTNIQFNIIANYDYVTRSLPLEANTTYTLSGGTELPKGVYLQVYGKVNNEDQYKTFMATPTTFSTAESVNWGCYIRFDSGVTVNNLTIYPQLEKGSFATEYEPYGYKIPITITNDIGTTVHNIFLDEPLRKIGDYADYIDFENHTVVRNIKKILLDGSIPVQLDDWRHVDGYYAIGYALRYIPDIYKSNSIGYILCEQLVNKTYANLYSTSTVREGIATASSPTYSIFIRFKTEEITNKSEYYEYLNINPFTIHYVSTTPTEEPIVLPTISTTSGNTKISINTKIAPSNLELFYQYN